MEERIEKLESQMAAVIAWIKANHASIDGSEEGKALLSAVTGESPEEPAPEE